MARPRRRGQRRAAERTSCPATPGRERTGWRTGGVRHDGSRHVRDQPGLHPRSRRTDRRQTATARHRRRRSTGLRPAGRGVLRRGRARQRDPLRRVAAGRRPVRRCQHPAAEPATGVAVQREHARRRGEHGRPARDEDVPSHARRVQGSHPPARPGGGEGASELRRARGPVGLAPPRSGFLQGHRRAVRRSSQLAGHRRLGRRHRRRPERRHTALSARDPRRSRPTSSMSARATPSGRGRASSASRYRSRRRNRTPRHR